MQSLIGTGVALATPFKQDFSILLENTFKSVFRGFEQQGFV